MANIYSDQEGKIIGARYAPFKSQLLVSSGMISIDSIAGGGLPVGTLLLVEESETSVYSSAMLKHFLAEGVVCSHSMFLASLECDLHEFVTNLPAVAESDDPSMNLSEEQMHIAWRYQNNPIVKTAQIGMKGNNFGHNFDISKVLSQESIAKSDFTCWPQPDQTGSETYGDLLTSLRTLVEIKKSKEKQNVQTILRIALQSLGSPLWHDCEEELPIFLYQLRHIVHDSNSIAMITIPTKLFQKAYIVSRCEHICDNIIRLESLGDQSNPLFNEYSGLIKFKKLSAINTLAPHILEYSDWAFTLHRKRLLIERMHLPPELETTTGREQDDLVSCSKSGTSQLQF